MSDDESTGAVEIAVVEFPGSKFKGEIVPAMIDLVESGINLFQAEAQLDAFE